MFPSIDVLLEEVPLYYFIFLRVKNEYLPKCVSFQAIRVIPYESRIQTTNCYVITQTLHAYYSELNAFLRLQTIKYIHMCDATGACIVSYVTLELAFRTSGLVGGYVSTLY